LLSSNVASNYRDEPINYHVAAPSLREVFFALRLSALGFGRVKTPLQRH
jgi:hypothetical protein